MKTIIFAFFLIAIYLPSAFAGAWCATSCINTECSIQCPIGQSAICSCENNAHYAHCYCQSGIKESLVNDTHCFCATKDQKVGCSPLNGPCSSNADCCFNCTGVSCWNGMCIPGTCLSRGTNCNVDCQCCSGDCEQNETDWGTCT